MKYHTAQLQDLDRDYVKKADVRREAGDRREVWTLRIIAFGTVASFALGVASLVHGGGGW